MKKSIDAPYVNVCRFEAKDVITTSVVGNSEGGQVISWGGRTTPNIQVDAKAISGANPTSMEW